jgi:2-(1,2-epoxy-1,2-dihydrophenyl)acetyl-CoA isomerase
MATDHLLETNDSGVAVLTLNRPDVLNAMSRPMLEALLAAVKRAATDDDVGCIVLTGAGRGFCSGGDVRAMTERNEKGAGTLESKAGDLRERMEVSRLLHESPKPTIAMINGPVAGAGIGVAGSCDLRFAGASATFLSAYVNIGAGGDYGATYVWPKILGAAKARELFLMNEKFDAAQGLAFGLYNRVFPDETLREETLKVARRIARGPSSSWAYMKANLNASEEEGFARHLDRESMNMGLSTQAFFTALKAQQRAAAPSAD